jgi:hypothetical protein
MLWKVLLTFAIVGLVVAIAIACSSLGDIGCGIAELKKSVQTANPSVMEIDVGGYPIAGHFEDMLSIVRIRLSVTMLIMAVATILGAIGALIRLKSSGNRTAPLKDMK